MRPASRLFGSAFIFTIAGIDALSKWWAIENAPLASATRLKPIFAIALHKNPGIAFDLPLPLAVILPLTLVICGAFCYLVVKNWKQTNHSALAALAVVVGALGNLVDRVLNGFTTDYLIFFRTSAINLSDILIVVGMIGFLWHTRSKQPPNSPIEQT